MLHSPADPRRCLPFLSRFDIMGDVVKDFDHKAGSAPMWGLCNAIPPKYATTTSRNIVASFFERSSNGRSFFVPFKGRPKMGRPYGDTVPLPCDAVPDRQRCHQNTRHSVAIWVKFGFLCAWWGIVRAREENGKFADDLGDNAREDRPHQTVPKCV